MREWKVMLNKQEYKLKKNIFFIIFVAFLLLRPSPTLVLGPSLGMRLMDLIIILLLIGFIFLKRNKKYALDINFIILSLLLFLQLFSILLANFKGNVTIEDLFEIYRPVLYLLIYLIVKETANLKSLNVLYSLISLT